MSAHNVVSIRSRWAKPAESRGLDAAFAERVMENLVQHHGFEKIEERVLATMDPKLFEMYLRPPKRELSPVERMERYVALYAGRECVDPAVTRDADENA